MTERSPASRHCRTVGQSQLGSLLYSELDSAFGGLPLAWAWASGCPNSILLRGKETEMLSFSTCQLGSVWGWCMEGRMVGWTEGGRRGGRRCGTFLRTH